MRCRRAIRFLLLLGTFGVLTSLSAQDFMMQGWYWDYPKPANPTGDPATESTWAKTLNGKVTQLSDAGFTHLWLPPMSRSSFGSQSNGYDPMDLYDYGGYGLGATGFGFQQDVDQLIANCSGQGIETIADVVYNHRDGGKAEANPAVKEYITNYFYHPGKNPYPSDRFRVRLPLGGNSGHGAGTYYIKFRSKTMHSAFHNAPYRVYAETGAVGWQNLPDLQESEPNGGGGCGESGNTLELGRNLNATIDAYGCMWDEFVLTLDPADFNSSGDNLLLYMSNQNGNYSDHYPLEIWYNGQNIAGQLIFETYTDFTDLPSGKGEMNYKNFRPHDGSASYETLTGDWNWKWFFFDYDQSVSDTRNKLFDWSTWLYNDVGIRGYRMDAVKHFSPDFVGDLMDHLHDQGVQPNMVVGEFFDSNAGTLNNWLGSVKNAMDTDTKAAIDVRAFDFSLRQALKDACDAYGYDVRNVFNSGIVNQAGGSPFEVVTFINNHDYRYAGQPVQNDPMLAYAYILTNNQIGLPCVFYPDYFGTAVPNYPTVNLQTEIDQLLQVHQQYIYQAPSADYLSRFNTPYYQWFASGYPNTTLVYQLSGGIAGKEVVVAINFAGEELDLYQEINMTNVAPGETFTDILDLANGNYHQQLTPKNELHIHLPPRSYAIYVQGQETPLVMNNLELEVEAFADYADVRWETTHEEGIASFELERSLDGETFSRISTVEPLSEESHTGAAYLHLDKDIRQSGNVYYRIKTNYDDGTVKYSPTRLAFFREQISNFELIPNPTKGESMLQVESRYNNIVVLKVFDAVGNAIILEKRSIHEGINQLEINLHDQPDGVYFIRCESPGGSDWTGRLVKTQRNQ